MYQLRYQDGQAIYTDENEKVTIAIAQANCIGMAKLPEMPVIESDDVYQMMLSAPSHGESLLKIAREKKPASACILISDASRKVPTQKVAGAVVEVLQEAGISLEKIVFIVAIGVHRDATEAEFREFIGEKYFGRVPMINHNPYDADGLISLGNTSYHTPVEVNRRAYECDLHIAIGKVEPHEFAGYSGGRKSVLPGISSETTIRANHSPRMLFSKDAIPGSIENNPVHLDMTEAAERFRLDFVIQFVLNDLAQPSAIFSGEMGAAHMAAIAYLKKYCGVKIVEKPDLIITTPGIPLNIDFYQSIKPLIALNDVVDTSVTLAMYSQCHEGVQSPDMLEPFFMTRTQTEMEQYVLENYRIQMDHALLLSKTLKKCADIYISSPNVEDVVVEKMYMKPYASPQEMLEQAISNCKTTTPRVLFFPMAQKALPYR